MVFLHSREPDDPERGPALLGALECKLLTGLVHQPRGALWVIVSVFRVIKDQLLAFVKPVLGIEQVRLFPAGRGLN